jgi:hypothetical protein
MSKIILAVFVFVSCYNLYSQNLKFSKSKIIFAYTEVSPELADTLTIYNDGNNDLIIDSIYSVNFYGYKLSALLKDTAIYYYVFSGQDSIKISISPKDSAILIFSEPSLCPICKKLLKPNAFIDSILFHSNSPNNEYSYLDVEGLVYVNVEEEQIEPSNYVLHQNYPNPFNSNTKIMYELPENLFVNFRLYDCLGNTLMVLVNERQDPGTYSVEINTFDFPSGIYFYRIIAGSYIETKKMVILK